MDFLISAVSQATLVSKAVLVLLLFMSLVSWAFMGGKWLALFAARRRAAAGIDGMDAAPWMFWFMTASVLIGGLVGGLIGRAVLKKHFVKAGLA